ncbi:unnamed protein product (mitochondrion) [Sympodiomycopsis kandeliae]
MFKKVTIFILVDMIDVIDSIDELNSNIYHRYAENINSIILVHPADIDNICERNYSVHNTLKSTGNTIIKNTLSVKPWWITGFADGEGSFSIKKTNTINQKSSFSLEFKVTQHKVNENVLHAIKEYFKVGNVVIDNRETNTIKYQVQSNTHINKVIIPHFNNYPLVTSKHLDYVDWKNVSDILIDKSKYTREEITKIVIEKKQNMNNARSEYVRWAYLQKECPSVLIQPNWLQGFIDAERTFQFDMGESNSRGKPYIRANPTIEIRQSNHDVIVLEIIKKYLRRGFLKPKFNIIDFTETIVSRAVSRYVRNDESAIIKFIDEYPLMTNKNLDYLDWKRLIQIKKEESHKTAEGFNKIKLIKENINRGRAKLLYNYFNLYRLK